MAQAAFAADITDTAPVENTVQEEAAEEAVETEGLYEEDMPSDIQEAVEQEPAEEAALEITDEEIPAAETETEDVDAVSEEVLPEEDILSSGDPEEEIEEKAPETVKEEEGIIIEEDVAAEENSNDAEEWIYTVKDEESGIVYEESSVGINVGETWHRSLPLSGSNEKIGAYTIKWSSSDKSIATVSSGKVKGIAAGSVDITGTVVAKSTGKEYRYAKYVVTVFGELQDFDLPAFYLSEGEKHSMYIETTPGHAIINDATGTSADRKVAEVDASAFATVGSQYVMLNIKGVSNGKTKVTVTIQSKTGSITKTAIVMVGPFAKMDKPSYTMKKGTTRKLGCTVSPASEAVTWTSSNTAVATVKQDGTVTAVSNGTATISCVPKGNPAGKATCKITVKTPVSGITLNRANATVLMGYTFALKATVAPSAASNKAVEWTTSDRRVASVDENGVIIGVAKGKATITCTAKDGSGKKATCAVTVKIPVYSITLNRAAATMTKGKVFQLKATIEPSLADNKAVTWKSSNTAVVTVDSTGRMTGVGKGTAVVTCTAKDGSGVKATCKVTGK